MKKLLALLLAGLLAAATFSGCVMQGSNTNENPPMRTPVADDRVK